MSTRVEPAAGQVDSYLARFRELPPDVGDWLRPLREEAIGRFASEGFPGRKNEDWKYTSVAPVAAVSFQPAPQVKAPALAEVVSVGTGVELVFGNGRFVPELSNLSDLPSGVTVGSLRGAAEHELLRAHLETVPGEGQGALPALNSAFFTDGALVHIGANVRVDVPIHVLFQTEAGSDPVFTTPRVLIVADEGAEVSVVESYRGHGRAGYFTNAVSEIVLRPNASVRHTRVQTESAEAFHVGTVAAHQARSSRFRSRAISIGGSLSRTAVLARLEGEGAECSLDGLYLARGRQHVDHRTTIDHLVPHGTSRELYKGILDDQATGVFNGKVFVRPDAQKSDAQQMNRTLLLSEGATINTKPQLEIFADDVKCSHGATIGRLDDEALFYLRSRGLEVQAARALLIHAFANEMIEPLELASLRDRLRRALEDRFGVDTGAGE